ncbi:hypothetical protein DRO41_05875 [Candidatus Bathyarchaeota archaeon]|nr:MAG: hypothetical protein DRO41_05875 [Candidatus Bathyarchaeota archaeon]
MIEQISVETMIIVLIVSTYFALWTSVLRRVYTCRELGKLLTAFIFVNYLVYCSFSFVYAKIKQLWERGGDNNV